MVKAARHRQHDVELAHVAATGEAKYADVIERALYNGINSGMSLNGTLYCYRNPLAFDPSGGDKIRTNGTTPPAARRISSARWLLCQDISTALTATACTCICTTTRYWIGHLENGTALKIRQKTNYPWDGATEIVVTPAQPTEFTLFVRIPGWSGLCKGRR